MNNYNTFLKFFINNKCILSHSKKKLFSYNKNINKSKNKYNVFQDINITNLTVSKVTTDREFIKLCAYIDHFNDYENFITIKNINNDKLTSYIYQLNRDNNHYFFYNDKSMKQDQDKLKMLIKGKTPYCSIHDYIMNNKLY
jgi:hypothetical protein